MRQETIDRIRRFTEDRDWDQFHTPANLAKSISIEANELLECYQWSDDADLEHVREELADVIVYGYAFPGSKMGCFHASELPVLFGVKMLGYDGEKDSVGTTLRSVWSRFAREGTPGWEKGTTRKIP